MDQVETTARAMCEADGHAADESVTLPEGAGASRDGGPAAGGPVPRWRIYEPQARRLVEAQQALLAGR